MMPRRTAGRSPSIPPSSSAHPPQPADEEQETALAISDQRTLYLVNIFIGNAARFLNNFADLCQDKLADVHRRILRLDLPDANGKENFTARERTSLGTFGEATNSMVVVIYFSGASTDSMVEAIILSSLITTVDSNGDIFLVRNCFAC